MHDALILRYSIVKGNANNGTAKPVPPFHELNDIFKVFFMEHTYYTGKQNFFKKI